MQTFLPHIEFFEVSKILDKKRLGKQRVEGMQIINAMDPERNSKWRNHPAVRMWSGYEDCLKYYVNWMIREWIVRGMKNEMSYYELEDPFNFEIPDWLYDKRLVLSHRCNLMRKDPEYYSRFGWKDIDLDAPYWWPVPLKDSKNQKIMVNYWGE